MMKTQTCKINVKNSIYELTFTRMGTIALERIGGRSKRGDIFHPNPDDPHNLWPEYTCAGDTGLLDDARPLFRKVSSVVAGWVAAHHPPIINFYASTDRKQNVYRWLARRMAKKLPMYQMSEFPVGQFNFYRITDNEKFA